MIYEKSHAMDTVDDSCLGSWDHVIYKCGKLWRDETSCKRYRYLFTRALQGAEGKGKGNRYGIKRTQNPISSYSITEWYGFGIADGDTKRVGKVAEMIGIGQGFMETLKPKEFDMKLSKFLTLGVRDFIRSAIVAAGTGAGFVLLPALSSGNLPTLVQLKMAGIAAVCAGGSYIIKNLFTNSKDQIGKPEEK